MSEISAKHLLNRPKLTALVGNCGCGVNCIGNAFNGATACVDNIFGATEDPCVGIIKTGADTLVCTK